MRRRQGGLVANEEALLELLADVFPSWVTTGDLLRMVHDRQDAGRWLVRRAVADGKVRERAASSSKVNEATVYRILARFTEHGWLDVKWWVPDDPWSKDRPARIVALNDDGRARARELAIARHGGES